MKKILKSILIMAILACVTITFTGCGKNDDEKNIKDKVENAIEKTEEVLEQENATVEENVTSTEFSMGEWKNNVYENEFLGVKFNLPEGWTYSSDEEIAEMMNLGTELLNDDQKAVAEVAKLTSVTYVVANNPNTGNSVTIMSEKPVMEVTTEYYINQLKTQLTAVETMSYEIGEISKEKVADVEYDTLTVSIPDYGITQKYYVHKMDKYFVCIISTSVNGETGINEIVECFE